MSQNSTNGGTGTGEQQPGRSRRQVVLLGTVAAVVVAALVALALVLTARGGTTPAASSSSTATRTGAAATGTGSTGPVPAPSSPAAPGTTANAAELPSELPAVPLASTASVGNGVVATLPSIRGIQAQASGPGNIAGPAVQVTVRIQNGTGSAIGLGGVAVNVYYGADRTPASPVDDPSTRPFSGTLAAGKSADGTYVFSVPSDARQAVTVEVGYQAGAPLLNFTGPVG